MRAVLLTSGGVESLVVAAFFRKQFPDGIGHAIHIDYGHRAFEREAEAVWKVCQRYGLAGVTAEAHMPWLSGHMLVDENKVAVTNDRVRPRKSKVGNARANIVPYRNLVFLSMAASYAATVGADSIFAGFDYLPDAPGSARDKSPEFVSAFTSVLYEANDGFPSTTVRTPINGSEKYETVQYGCELGVDWSESWSCYNGFPLSCGICSSCESRKNAFSSANATDKISYLKNPSKYLEV